jgi:hypothetical protein
MSPVCHIAVIRRQVGYSVGRAAKRHSSNACFGAMILIAAILQLSGCAAPAGLAIFSASTGVAMGTSVDYTLNGIAYKTFVSPMPTVRQATLAGLNRMGMKVNEDKKSESGWSITASAEGRDIDIQLERLTPRTTRMRVVANNGPIFKDRATEAAIIDEAADALDRRTTLHG